MAATDRSFVEATAVLVSSFIRRNPWFEGPIYLIHDGVDAAARRRLDHLPGLRWTPADPALGAALRTLTDARPDLERRVRRFHSLHALRLDGHARVLYLDSDILCTGDVRPLLDVGEDEGAALAACPDIPRYRGGTRDRRTFLPVAPPAADAQPFRTFNSGVMVFRPEDLGPDRFVRILADLAPAQWAGIRSGHTDQVLLNRHFEGRWVEAGPTFNYLVTDDSHRWDRPPLEEARLVHFVGRPKPWQLKGTLPPPGSGPQRVRAWALWDDALWRDAADRVRRRGDAGPMARILLGRARRRASAWARRLRGTDGLDPTAHEGPGGGRSGAAESSSK